MKTSPASGRNWESDPGRVAELPANLRHLPVLMQPVLDCLAIRPGGAYLDGTLGAGGHAAAILQASSPDGRLLGLDRDPTAVEVARRRLEPFGERVVLAHATFADMGSLARQLGFAHFDGVLLDLGLSSLQLDDAPRGFSFRQDGPLDMRFDPDSRPSAADLVNDLPEDELADLIYRLGEEPDSRRIARAVGAARPLWTTRQLAGVIEAAARPRRQRSLHPATRTFMALRIAVNQELEALAGALPQAIQLLAPGGRLAVISFHSLEDRIVKQFFAREARDCLCPPRNPMCTCGHQATIRVTIRKPLRPTAAESARNPRSRSARLRVAERI